MKKLFLLMLAVICAGVMYGKKRVKVVPPSVRVAVVAPTATEGVSPIDISIVRGKMEQYISAMQGYEVITRNDIDQVIDQIIIEMDLHRSGMINEADRKKLGTLKGVDIILVSTLTYGKGRLNVEAKFIHVETGTIEKSVSQLMNPKIPEDMEKACKMLAEKLTGVSSAGDNTLSYSQDSGNEVKDGVIIDGVTWAKKNAGAFNIEDYGNLYTWVSAQTACPNGWRLPTKEELERLSNTGSAWTSQNGKYGRKFGDANDYIFLPAGGCRSHNDYVGRYGLYWSSSSTEFDSSVYAYDLEFGSDFVQAISAFKTNGYSVRCVAE